MNYQLVIQFPEAVFEEIDEIADFENKLDKSLIDAEVDGHDIGNGECNIFIHTNNTTTGVAPIKPDHLASQSPFDKLSWCHHI